MNTKLDPYDVLRVTRTASAAEIAAAYRRRSKELHPDAGGNPEDFARLKFCRDLLLDDGRRQRYDATGDVTEQNVDNATAAALSMIAGFLMQACMADVDPVHQDVVAALKDVVRRQLDSIDTSVAKFKTAKLRAERMAKRMTRKKKAKGNDLMGPLMQGMVTQYEQAIEQHGTKRVFAVRALEILEDYRFDPEAMRRIVASSATTSGSMSGLGNIFGGFR
jgi:curved DNA-binding protein CbpA